MPGGISKPPVCDSEALRGSNEVEPRNRARFKNKTLSDVTIRVPTAVDHQTLAQHRENPHEAQRSDPFGQHRARSESWWTAFLRNAARLCAWHGGGGAGVHLSHCRQTDR